MLHLGCDTTWNDQICLCHWPNVLPSGEILSSSSRNTTLHRTEIDMIWHNKPVPNDPHHISSPLVHNRPWARDTSLTATPQMSSAPARDSCVGAVASATTKRLNCAVNQECCLDSSCTQWRLEPDPAGFHAAMFVGCFVDDEDRDFCCGPKKYGYDMASCAASCVGYSFFALQNGGWCSCDNDYGTPLSMYFQVNDSECNAGRFFNKTVPGIGFGGVWRNAVYENLTPTSRMNRDGTLVWCGAGPVCNIHGTAIGLQRTNALCGPALGACKQANPQFVSTTVSSCHSHLSMSPPLDPLPTPSCSMVQQGQHLTLGECTLSAAQAWLLPEYGEVGPIRLRGNTSMCISFRCDHEQCMIPNSYGPVASISECSADSITFERVGSYIRVVPTQSRQYDKLHNLCPCGNSSLCQPVDGKCVTNYWCLNLRESDQAPGVITVQLSPCKEPGRLAQNTWKIHASRGVVNAAFPNLCLSACVIPSSQRTRDADFIEILSEPAPLTSCLNGDLQLSGSRTHRAVFEAGCSSHLGTATSRDDRTCMRMCPLDFPFASIPTSVQPNACFRTRKLALAVSAHREGKRIAPCGTYCNFHMPTSEEDTHCGPQLCPLILPSHTTCTLPDVSGLGLHARMECLLGRLSTTHNISLPATHPSVTPSTPVPALCQSPCPIDVCRTRSGRFTIEFDVNVVYDGPGADFSPPAEDIRVDGTFSFVTPTQHNTSHGLLIPKDSFGTSSSNKRNVALKLTSVRKCIPPVEDPVSYLRLILLCLLLALSTAAFAWAYIHRRRIRVLCVRNNANDCMERIEDSSTSSNTEHSIFGGPGTEFPPSHEFGHIPDQEDEILDSIDPIPIEDCTDGMLTFSGHIPIQDHTDEMLDSTGHMPTEDYDGEMLNSAKHGLGVLPLEIDTPHFNMQHTSLVKQQSDDRTESFEPTESPEALGSGRWRVGFTNLLVAHPKASLAGLAFMYMVLVLLVLTTDVPEVDTGYEGLLTDDNIGTEYKAAKWFHSYASSDQRTYTPDPNTNRSFDEMWNERRVVNIGDSDTHTESHRKFGYRWRDLWDLYVIFKYDGEDIFETKDYDKRMRQIVDLDRKIQNFEGHLDSVLYVEC